MISTITVNMKSTITLMFNVMKAKNAKTPELLLAHFCNKIRLIFALKFKSQNAYMDHFLPLFLLFTFKRGTFDHFGLKLWGAFGSGWG